MTPQNENSASFTARSAHERTTARATGIEAAVCDDIALRQALGIAKYGTTVADNPLELRAWLQHAYEETLDKAIYLKRAIAEIERSELGRQVMVNRAKPLADFITGIANELDKVVKQARAAVGPSVSPEHRSPTVVFKADRVIFKAAQPGPSFLHAPEWEAQQRADEKERMAKAAPKCAHSVFFTCAPGTVMCTRCLVRAPNDELPACTQAVDHSNHPDHP